MKSSGVRRLKKFLLPGDDFLPLLSREMKRRGSFADREESLFDVLSDSPSCLDVVALRHPMKPHVRDGLVDRGEFVDTRFAAFVNPTADVSLCQLLGVDVSEPFELVVVADRLGHRDLRILRLDKLRVLAGLVFRKLEFLGLLFYVEMVFKRERLWNNDCDCLAGPLPFGHKRSLTDGLRRLQVSAGDYVQMLEVR